MKVLIDECAPRALKNFLSKHGHESLTVQEAGWSGKENGELLAIAETEFDVLVTLDTNLRYQQNIRARSNRLSALSPHFVACAEALQIIKPGDIIHVSTAT